LKIEGLRCKKSKLDFIFKDEYVISSKLLEKFLIFFFKIKYFITKNRQKRVSETQADLVPRKQQERIRIFGTVRYISVSWSRRHIKCACTKYKMGPQTPLFAPITFNLRLPKRIIRSSSIDFFFSKNINFLMN
jgi:hypothetical protein